MPRIGPFCVVWIVSDVITQAAISCTISKNLLYNNTHHHHHINIYFDPVIYSTLYFVVPYFSIDSIFCSLFIKTVGPPLLLDFFLHVPLFLPIISDPPVSLFFLPLVPTGIRLAARLPVSLFVKASHHQLSPCIGTFSTSRTFSTVVCEPKEFLQLLCSSCRNVLSSEHQI